MAAASEVVRMSNAREAEGFIAVSPEQRKRFWLERSRTAAISRHTNAFKVNEDVVIPLPRMGDYCDGIERINIELSIRNKLDLCDALTDMLSGKLPLDQGDAGLASEELIGDRRDAALTYIGTVRRRWKWLLDNLDLPLAEAEKTFTELGIVADEFVNRAPKPTLFHRLQDASIRVSWKTELQPRLSKIFDGTVFRPVLEKIDALHAKVLRGRVFVALHMHAGDGNVHTNIPVNSDNYEMLQTAYRAVDRIMALARSLGGVISGEHGIGITKLDYLTEEELASFRAYKAKIDPNGHFNRGKLMPGANLANAYTPSFNLMGYESLIMEQTEIGNITSAIKDCLRCGKCKPVCSTHVPRANLLYSPRNKILSTSLLVEALLYEEQTRRGVSLTHWSEIEDLSDHCTVCHRCEKPCPVDIDFGKTTIKIRNLLRGQRKRSFNPGKLAALAFLTVKEPSLLGLMRTGMRWAYKLQRLAHGFGRKSLLLRHQLRTPPATVGRPKLKAQVIHLINRPMPGNLPSKSSRALLDMEDAATIPVIRDPSRTNAESEAVFYFPGCGSERLFSQVSLATQAMLYHLGVQTVLPPGYLCCGYPQAAAGSDDKGQRITTENRVLFHRVANTLNYLDIKTVLVSCGTCMDQLQEYEFDKIFPGCRLLDIHEYLLEKGIRCEGASKGIQYLFHEPCHTPMKQYASIEVANKLMGVPVTLSDRCCGEAGTLAVSRPDISTQVRFRKQEELETGIAARDAAATTTRVLTACPSCLQGLMRYRKLAGGLKADYLLIELARHTLGENWMKEYVEKANNGGIERVLL